MPGPFILDKYRALRVEEREAAEKAILWLKKKHLRIEEIVFLSERNIDREKKLINVRREGKIATIYRQISYAESQFELYLTEVFPCLKSNRFIFVRWAFTGRSPELCQHIETEAVEKIIKQKPNSLLTLAQKFGNIRIAKVNLHIRN